jgi:hypothetical protein
MNRSVPLISVGYSAGAKGLVSVAGIVGPALIVASIVRAQEDISPPYWLCLGGLAVLWIGGLLDVFARRLWLYPDRVVSRDLFFRRVEIRYRDVTELLKGADQIVIRSAGGQSIRVLGKLARYQEVIYTIGQATGFQV